MASVRSAEAQVLQARAQLATAQTNLDKARIYSPVNGVVLSRDIEPGQTVAASLNAPVLFTIAEDLSQMELEVSVDEDRSEEHTSELQSLMRISYAVFCLKKKIKTNRHSKHSTTHSS